MRVDGGAIFVLGCDVQVLDATFAHGVAVFVKEDFPDAHRRNTVMARLLQASVQGQALGKVILGYGAWVLAMYFAFMDHFCGVSAPR